jgi:hypothetical protein
MKEYKKDENFEVPLDRYAEINRINFNHFHSKEFFSMLRG